MVDLVSQEKRDSQVRMFQEYQGRRETVVCLVLMVCLE
jgi:hypothetical protein